MIILQFGFTGLKANRGCLFGEYKDRKITTIRLLFVTISVCNKKLSDQMYECLRHSIQHEKWYIEHCDEVKNHKRKVTDEITSRLEARYREDLDSSLKEKCELHDKLTKRNGDVWKLERAIEVMMGLKDRSEQAA